MSFLVSLFKPLAYFSLPVILVRQIAVGSSPARYYARVVVYVGTLMTVASCSIVVAAGLSLLGRSSDVNNFVARMFYGIIHRALDLTIEVEGGENMKTNPAVFMANHQSMLDVLVIGRLMPKQTAIMAKKSLQYTPLGPFMTMAGTIFIDRGNNARAIRSIEAAGEKMKANKVSLWMFPEGTRHMSKANDMLSLKKGGFHLAINAGIPIVPIVTENYWHMYRKGVFGSGIIKVRVLPPVPTTSLTTADVGTLTISVREQMLAALHDISPKVPESSSSRLTPASDEKTPVSATSTDDSEASVPLESPPPAIGTAPEFGQTPLQSQGSSSSLASSSFSSGRLRQSGTSENGAETEEDEGMVLVGRPTA